MKKIILLFLTLFFFSCSKQQPPNNTIQNSKINETQKQEIKIPGDFTSASEKYLNRNDILNMTENDLQIMRNEIFARYGYIFEKNSEMDKYFSQKSWYKTLSNNVEDKLTDKEKKNVDLIRQVEKEKYGWKKLETFKSFDCDYKNEKYIINGQRYKYDKYGYIEKDIMLKSLFKVSDINLTKLKEDAWISVKNDEPKQVNENKDLSSTILPSGSIYRLNYQRIYYFSYDELNFFIKDNKKIIVDDILRNAKEYKIIFVYKVKINVDDDHDFHNQWGDEIIDGKLIKYYLDPSVQNCIVVDKNNEVKYLLD